MSDSTSQKPYRLGIALSGGGARGFAHVGALKALSEAGIKPDVLAGVSAGSVVAVLYSAGLPFSKILKLFSQARFRDFCEFKIKGGGLFRIDKFKRHIAKAIPDFKNLEDLPIPTYIGATDFDNGVPVAFENGPIMERMVASCSIPIIFQPVTIDGVRYVDGGVLHNIPAWILRDKCEKLIGINCSPLDNRKTKNSIFEVGMRAYSLMLKGNVADDMALCDMQIEIPEMVDYKTFDLKAINTAYLRGYTTTRQILKEHGYLMSRTETGNTNRTDEE